MEKENISLKMSKRHSLDTIGYSRRMNFDRPIKYDVGQLDIEWFPKLQELLECQITPNETSNSRSRQVVEKEEVKTRFRMANDLERGNTLIRNYRERLEQNEAETNSTREGQEKEDVDEVDSLGSRFTAIAQPLVNQMSYREMSTREQIHNRGVIPVKALQERLLGWNRKDLGKS